MKTIWSGNIFHFAHRHHINTDARRDIECPIIHRHTRHNILLPERPPLAYATVLYPYFGIIGCQFIGDIRILDKHSRVRLHFMMHDDTLVNNSVLNIKRR